MPSQKKNNSFTWQWWNVRICSCGFNCLKKSNQAWPQSFFLKLLWLCIWIGGGAITGVFISSALLLYFDSSSPSLDSNNNLNVVVFDESSGGQLYYASRDFNVISSSLQQHCFNEGKGVNIQFASSMTRLDRSVDLLLCFAMIHPGTFCNLHVAKRSSIYSNSDHRNMNTQLVLINSIPHLRSSIWRKDSLCSITRRIGDEQSSIPCLVVDVLDGGSAISSEDMWHVGDFMDKIRMSQYYYDKTPFIVKPGDGGEGKGIFTIATISELELILKSNQIRGDGIKSSRPNKKKRIMISSKLIVSPLLMNPFLINHRKVDLRCYVLITDNIKSRTQQQEQNNTASEFLPPPSPPPFHGYHVYFYHDCLVRIALEPFSKTAKRGGRRNQWMTNTFHSRNEANSNDVDVLTLSSLVDVVKQSQKLSNDVAEELQGDHQFDNGYGYNYNVDGNFISIDDIGPINLKKLQSTAIATITPSLREALLLPRQQQQQHVGRFHLAGVDLFLDDHLNMKLIEWNGIPSMSATIERPEYRQLKHQLWESAADVVGLCSQQQQQQRSMQSRRMIPLSLHKVTQE
eukprot:m.129590 g.129590  ORF g.129590 m.129590 type:complete len:571 (+) comp13048_c0_seq12:244-1956(+)